jgi:predicted CopG family antitoxin
LLKLIIEGVRSLYKKKEGVRHLERYFWDVNGSQVERVQDI